ncbi:MAG: putative beta-1,3-galactosyltransferase [Candidatus Woesebacteria bacterium GW2011_GWC1_38_13]|uniref:Putative beta-1,3-galactosyltransferase n=3 Tax=Candidatus Woeseibacteriota TaxID=1752722 RepID=A0A0G0L8J1_9BACT|nr:MAG: putative beta-1,3-galactosyltransferase [Candidatus Woesebacteria bacterium GW2011_GWC1_38_13]KKQ84160.1 MAG: putative beta-1,3-galactosyltransferase [Candidatus Woesebacteria bacterium GW2011_GWA1_38_8]
MKRPLVSVIVPTYNEEKNIQKCLISLKNQTYRNIEVIVVDSLKSKDKTFRIAKKYSQAFKFGIERSEQRNYGVKKSQGQYLLFVDADMRLYKNVIRECVEKIYDGCFSVIIPEVSIGKGFWAKCKVLEKRTYMGDDLIEAPRFFIKKIYLKLGGYNDKMVSGEDWDLGRRFRKEGNVGRVKSLIIHNEGRLTLIADLKKKLYYAKMADSYLKESEIGTKDVIKFIFRPAYIRNWKMFLSDPLHTLGLFIMKIMEMLVGGFGAIIYKKSFWMKFKHN